jgi:hypothetical protein
MLHGTRPASGHDALPCPPVPQYRIYVRVTCSELAWHVAGAGRHMKSRVHPSGGTPHSLDWRFCQVGRVTVKPSWLAAAAIRSS